MTRQRIIEHSILGWLTVALASLVYFIVEMISIVMQ